MTVNIANISLGTGPGTGTGIPIREAFGIVNTNFANLKTVVDGFVAGNVSTGNLRFDSQTITGTVNNTDITIDPLGIGEVEVAGNLRTSYLSFRGSTITSQYSGDLVLNASLGNIKVSDPLKFPDNTIQTTAYTGDYTALHNKPVIPTHTGNLVNNSGYITNADLLWGSIIGRPTVISQFVNDTGFITMADITANSDIDGGTASTQDTSLDIDGGGA